MEKNALLTRRLFFRKVVGLIPILALVSCSSPLCVSENASYKNEQNSCNNSCTSSCQKDCSNTCGNYCKYNCVEVCTNGSLKFEITAKRLYAASQRVL